MVKIDNMTSLETANPVFAKLVQCEGGVQGCLSSSVETALVDTAVVEALSFKFIQTENNRVHCLS